MTPAPVQPPILHNPNVRTLTVPTGKTVTISMSGIFFYVLQAAYPIIVTPSGNGDFLSGTGTGKTVPRFENLTLKNPGPYDCQLSILADEHPFVTTMGISRNGQVFTTTSILTAYAATNVLLAKPAYFAGGLQNINGFLCQRRGIILQNLDGAISAAFADQYGGGNSVRIAPGVVTPELQTDDSIFIGCLGAQNTSIQIAAVQNWYPVLFP